MTASTPPGSQASGSTDIGNKLIIAGVTRIALLDPKSGEVKQIYKVDGIDVLFGVAVEGDEIVALGQKNGPGGATAFSLITIKDGKQKSQPIKTPDGSTTFKPGDGVGNPITGGGKVYASYHTSTKSGVMDLRTNEYVDNAAAAYGNGQWLITAVSSTWTAIKPDGSPGPTIGLAGLKPAWEKAVNRTGLNVAFREPAILGNDAYFIGFADIGPRGKTIFLSALVKWPLDGSAPVGVTLGEHTGSGVLARIFAGKDGVLVIYGGGGGTKIALFDHDLKEVTSLASSCEVIPEALCQPYVPNSTRPAFLDTFLLPAHLIEGLWVHQGSNAVYRLDPKTLKPMLELPSNFMNGLDSGQTKVGDKP